MWPNYMTCLKKHFFLCVIQQCLCAGFAVDCCHRGFVQWWGCTQTIKLTFQEARCPKQPFRKGNDHDDYTSAYRWRKKLIYYVLNVYTISVNTFRMYKYSIYLYDQKTSTTQIDIKVSNSFFFSNLKFYHIDRYIFVLIVYTRHTSCCPIKSV